MKWTMDRGILRFDRLSFRTNICNRNLSRKYGPKESGKQQQQQQTTGTNLTISSIQCVYISLTTNSDIMNVGSGTFPPI